MIYSYGVSLPGTYHIKKGIVCQDSHKIIHCGDDTAIAVVADGLGSARYSDSGSRIAVTTAAEYCKKHIGPSDRKILETIKASFAAASKAIEKEAKDKNHGTEDYDTTLTMAVLVKDTLYYGHSGDSGIIALTVDGRYEAVTIQQRDDDGRVFPLHFKDRWEFARYDNKVSAVLLATDGILETFFPFYIRNAKVKIHVSLVHFFLDKHSLSLEKKGQEAAKKKITEFMENIPDEQVNDDKTVAVLINTSVPTQKQPKEYYAEPDWAELKRKYDDEWKREAYPEMFKDTIIKIEKHEEIREVTFLEDMDFFPKRRRQERPSNTKKIIVIALISVFVIAVIVGVVLLLIS